MSIPLKITSRKFQISEEVRKFIEEKISGLERYGLKINSISVIIDKETFMIPIEILVLGKYFTAKGVGKTADLQASFEMALSKISVQIKKYKDKIKNHKFKGNAEDMFDNKISGVSFRITEITPETYYLKEAEKELKRKEKDLLIFRNIEDGGLYVLNRNPAHSNELECLKIKNGGNK